MCVICAAYFIIVVINGRFIYKCVCCVLPGYTMELSGNYFTDDFFNNTGNEILKLEEINHLDPEFLVGKESLGILDLENINLSIQNTSGFTNRPLNAGFQCTDPNVTDLPTTSTAFDDNSFCPKSLNDSKVHSLQLSKFTWDDDSVIIDACASNDNLLQNFSQANKLESTDNKQNFTNMELRQQLFPDLRPVENENIEKELRDCMNTGNSKNVQENKTLSHSLISENRSWFDSLVSIEANYLAMKFEHNSVVDENDDLFNIFKTTPPKEFDLEEIIEENVYSEFNAFKTLDVIDSPEISQNEVCNLSNFKSSDDSHNSVVITNHSSIEQDDINKNDIESKRMTRSLSDGIISTSSALRNANLNEVKSILSNLSNIISNSLDNNKQKEGQNLLSSLADILFFDKHDSDSKEKLQNSNSSVNTSEQNCKCLNLHKNKSKTTKLEENATICSISKKKSLALPTSRLSVPSVLGNKIGKSSLDKKENLVKKLKPKRTESGFKKGPLKAIIPLGNMAKKIGGFQSKFLSTSLNKSNTHFPKILSSTPISEQPIKPSAQSTPETNYVITNRTVSSESAIQKKSKSDIPVSPLSRPDIVRPASLIEFSSNLNNSGHSSKSVPNLSNCSKMVINSSSENEQDQGNKHETKHSASELKKPNSNLKRSFSLGQEMKAGPSWLSKIKQNSSSRQSLGNSFKSASKVDSKLVRDSDLNCLKQRNKNCTAIKLGLKLSRNPGKENKT